jgi:hypothetical protein
VKPEEDRAVYEALAYLLERERQGRAARWRLVAAYFLGLVTAGAVALGALAWARAHPASVTYVVQPGSPRVPFELPRDSAPAKPTGVVDRFTLTAAPAAWELFPGHTVNAWLFNGVSPGPTLVVHAGDTVQVHVANRLPEPLTVEWHGLEVPFEAAGIPGISQAPIWPGHDYTYTFVATHPGTYFYRSSLDAQRQVDYGLYGAVVVLPPPGSPGPKFDVDQTLVLGEWPAPADYEAEAPTYMTINGHAYPATEPVWVRQGDLVRLRLINASGEMAHAMHLVGQTLWVIARDGIPADPEQVDTVDLMPGQSVDVAFVADRPGNWLLTCDVLDHQRNLYGPAMGGMQLLVRYRGFTGGLPPAANELALAELHLFDVRTALAAGDLGRAKAAYAAFQSAWGSVGRDVERVDPDDALKIDQMIAQTEPAWRQGPPYLPDALQRLDDTVQQAISNINGFIVGLPAPGA